MQVFPCQENNRREIKGKIPQKDIEMISENRNRITKNNQDYNMLY